jgi:hypothetical protein
MIKLVELLDEKSGKDLNDDNVVDSEDWKIARDRAIKKSKGAQNENHLTPDQPSMDHEAKMAKGELRDMIQNAAKLYIIIKEGQNLPGWVSAYITLASDYMHSVAEYMVQENGGIKEGKAVASNYQFTPEQFELLKSYGTKISGAGDELLVPDIVKIELDANKTQSEFKQKFYETLPPSDNYLASQVLSALNKALKSQVKIGNKTYWSLKGHRTKKGNFYFLNPYRTEK